MVVNWRATHGLIRFLFVKTLSRGLDIPLVLIYPKLKVCLNCGHVEFELDDVQIEQLENGVFLAVAEACFGTVTIL